MVLKLARYYETKRIIAVDEIWLTVLTQILIDLIVVYNSHWSISANQSVCHC